MVSVTLDRTDLRLLAEIQQHGRATNAELAARVNLSASACLRRPVRPIRRRTPTRRPGLPRSAPHPSDNRLAVA